MTYTEIITVLGQYGRVTAEKTLSILDNENENAEVTGLVLTLDKGRVAIVNSNAVRWLSAPEMREIMLGTKPTEDVK